MVFDWLANSPPIKQEEQGRGRKPCYEYLVWDTDGSEDANYVEHELNQLGKRGFNLIQVLKMENENKDHAMYRFYLKREK